MKKYELYKKEQNGLYRIRALIDIPEIKLKAGDLGGLVESESNLSQFDSAWVSGEARVSGKAQVSGEAQVSGGAWVFGEAQVSGEARVSGKAQVSGGAWVFGGAWVSGEAQVFDSAWVSGEAQVFGGAQISGKARISGKAQVFGGAWVSGEARVSGKAQVSIKESAIYLPLSYGITVTDNHVQIGCQQYTFEDFYGTCQEEADAEEVYDYQHIRNIVIPIMIMIEEKLNEQQ